MFVGTEIIESVQSKFDNVNCIFVATHTHSAPSLDPAKPVLGDTDESYLKQVSQSIFAGIRSILASKSYQNCRIKWADNDCPYSVYRRSKNWVFEARRLRFSKKMIMAPDKKRSINQKLSLLVVENDHSKAIGVIWSWPCHAVAWPT